MIEKQVPILNEKCKEQLPSTSKEKNLLGWMMLIAAVTTAIFVFHAVLGSKMNYQSWRAPMLSYYTIQSNIIVSIWLVIVSVNMLTNGERLKLGVNINLSAIVTCYILVTGIIYWAVLVPMFSRTGDSSWMYSASSIWLHTTTPIIMLLTHKYIRSLDKTIVPKLKLQYFYIYPVLYLIMALAFAMKGTYLYPMFNFEMIGWLGVIISLIVILIIFSGIYILLLRGRKPR